MLDPLSSRNRIAIVRRPYEDQRYREVNLIGGEYIYDVEQDDDEWWRGTTADGKRGLVPASHVVESAATNLAGVPPPLLSVRPAPKNRTLTMIVLRPYEAQEDDEINLIEGGYIYDVEKLDDGRWRGTTAGGKRGLFPASCVKESTAPNEAESIPASTSAPNLLGLLLEHEDDD